MSYGQGGTNFGDNNIANGGTINHYLLNEANDWILSRGTAANKPSGASGYAVGGLYQASDTGAIYANTGSITSSTFTLLESAIGGTATSLVDSNGVTALDTAAVASAVNNLRVTNSAAGAVSANAVILSAVGTDSAISIQISPKGATGLLTLGLAAGTGTITVGSSSTTQTVAIGAGAGASTVTLAGGVGGNTVNLANGAITAVTDTINIGTGTSTTSGGKAINIGTGVPGTSTTNTIAIGNGGTTTGTVGITIGSNGNAAHTTLIQGGSGTGAITLTPQTTGTIVIGATAGTGAITVGSSSTTQTLNLGTGAGVATINIGTGAAANVIKVGAASSLITLYGTASQSLATNRITAAGSNNAPTGNLTDAGGANIALATGLKVFLMMGSVTLQAGANTFNLNGGGNVAIKKASAPTVDIAVARAANSIVQLMYNGTSWLALDE